MRDGLAWVRQHLVPVISAQPLGIDPHTANPDDLVVTHSEEQEKSSSVVTQIACTLLRLLALRCRRATRSGVVKRGCCDGQILLLSVWDDGLQGKQIAKGNTVLTQ